MKIATPEVFIMQKTMVTLSYGDVFAVSSGDILERRYYMRVNGNSGHRTFTAVDLENGRLIPFPRGQIVYPYPQATLHPGVVG